PLLGRDLGHDGNDLRSPDVEADDEILAFLRHALWSLSRLAQRLLAVSRDAHREAVAVAKIDVVDARAAARERADRARVVGDEAREPVGRLIAPDFDRERSVPGGAQPPTAARGKPQLRDRQRARPERRAIISKPF